MHKPMLEKITKISMSANKSGIFAIFHHSPLRFSSLLSEREERE